jgi:glycosyltransferase involved in cell wall biosynthesis
MYLESSVSPEIHAAAGEASGNTDAASPSTRPMARPDWSPAWSVVIPFFNECDYIAHTLASLAGQDECFDLILVDNGSTDGSAGVAAAACRRLGLAFTLLHERRPGKVQALATGLAAVRTRWLATCDADTWYPADYLSKAGALLADGRCATAGAFYVDAGVPRRRHVAAALHMAMVARLLPTQCHTGGAGQVFCTASLRRAGGFDARRWNLVLEDHEIIHRVNKLGAIAYSAGFWCTPANRDRDRDSIRWTLIERLAYHFTPRPLRDQFFYAFLKRRLEARRLTSDRIRERSFQPAMA